ncbi:ABC transporter ATP-binding protein [Rathayibacter toxicus]|nr:ABC transporter ATP-binding protein [Rathayibacter toxicus]PPH68026.1 ABC transporter ATP-binding protein [Rathayibacter toxicus]PPH82129.1 ABC transporter ATP-binding protein [Rathayibacter toxicus]PPH92410.1 ABC transporter ATP-binding protein [Rathayibacter toxicus]PPI37088.1 ABC transporter ATP-binding protein [Rathayibacter toxicus]
MLHGSTTAAPLPSWMSGGPHGRAGGRRGSMRSIKGIRPAAIGDGATTSSAPSLLASSGAAVAVEGLGFRYSQADEQALHDISFTVEPGMVVALLGPNGAGKSTLVSVLIGLNIPDSGGVRVFTRVPREALRRGDIGTMLQSSGIADFVTVRDLVTFIGRQYRDPMPVGEALAAADLTSLARRRVEKLSGGERKRVRFALTLIGRSRLLVLDEPTNEMDVASRHSFWATVRAAAVERGATVFFTTHHMAEVDAAADRVIVMGRGRILADETPDDLRRRAGTPTVRFRWAGDPDPRLLDNLSAVLDFEPGDDVQILHTDQPDRTLRELVGFVPSAIDISVTEASLDSAYLAVIGGDTRLLTATEKGIR